MKQCTCIPVQPVARGTLLLIGMREAPTSRRYKVCDAATDLAHCQARVRRPSFSALACARHQHLGAIRCVALQQIWHTASREAPFPMHGGMGNVGQEKLYEAHDAPRGFKRPKRKSYFN
ncbi:hypothetical protein HAX54_015402 [Datura stramonium]|uniref:Uncharacterized protein n=1 Tax=Datura stramonium TaxID=4076 RepID=A0ABS8TPS6_DATST|nr:hypothetical protein [Datura stramonium]